MKQEQELPRAPEEPSQPDDIEIIEVVGMEEGRAVRAETDEVVVSFDEDAATSPEARSAVARRRDDDAQERLMRLRADFENLRKRIERERDEYYRHATASLVARLLPVIDNFERAMASMRQSGDSDSLMEGVALIHRQLLEELRREGLRPVDSVGRPFDPSVHEAVCTEASSKLPTNVVVEELQRGYYFEDRLLRPAMVRVSTDGQPEKDEGAGSEGS